MRLSVVCFDRARVQREFLGTFSPLSKRARALIEKKAAPY